MRPASNNLPPAVVAVMSYSGLAVARSLGRRGVKVYGLAESDQEIGMTSRYLTPVVLPTLAGTEQDLVDGLVRLARSIGQRAVIFATGDSIVLPLSRNRDILSRYYRFTLPESDVVERLVSKAGLAALADERNLPGPQTTAIDNAKSFKARCPDIAFPVLMKPMYSASWYLSEMVDLIGVRKVILCRDAAEFEHWYGKVSRVDPRVVLQEMIPGGDDRLYYVCGYFRSDGKLEAAFAGRKMRLTPIHFGSASFVQSVYDKELLQLSAELLGPLRYKGLFGVEFKKDPRDGVYKIIEVNARWGLWDGMAARCGIDLAFLAYAREVGLPFVCGPRYRDGVRWLSFRRDLDAFIDYHREGALSVGRWLYSLLGETEHAVFAADDPGPVLPEFKAILREKIGKRLRKIRC